jgi:hypothetical protein
MRNTVHLSQLMVPPTLSKLSYIHTVYAVPEALLPSLNRFTRFV